MKNFNLYIACLLLSIINNSCGKFLDPVSQSEYVPKSAEALNEMLLGSAYPLNTSDVLFGLPVLLDDDITTALWTKNETLSPERLPAFKAAFTWQPDAYEQMRTRYINHNFWKNHYSKIVGANAALEYIGAVSGSDMEKKIVKAQALTLRAFYYFYLVNLYGLPYSVDKKNLGVPLKLSAGLNAEPQKRNTVEEVYTQIVLDLKEAENLYSQLPIEKQWSQNYRTSLPLAQLLLSKTYLYMEDWENAALLAEKVVNNGSFTLINFNNLPSPTTSNPYFNFNHYQNSEVIWLYGRISDMNGFVSQVTGSGSSLRYYFNASEDLLNSYLPEDLRKSKYIVTERYNKAVYKPMAKYLINSSYTGGSDAFGKSFRLAEAYLILAESNAMLYKKTSDSKYKIRTLDILNQLRRSRFSTYNNINIDQVDELIELVHSERRREMCFEGDRWFDLRRYGMPEIKHVWRDSENQSTTFTLKAKDPAYTIPIPTEAIEVNNQLEQNPLPSIRNN